MVLYQLETQPKLSLLSPSRHENEDVKRQEGGQEGPGKKRQAPYPEFQHAERAAFVRVSADAPDTLASVSSVNRLARRVNQMQRDS